MFVSAVAVDELSDIHADVERAFGRRHELELIRRLDHPLPLLTVAGDVLLEGLRVVVLAVALQDATRVIKVADVFTREHAGAC